VHPAALVKMTVVHDRVLLFIYNTALALVAVKRNREDREIRSIELVIDRIPDTPLYHISYINR